MYVTTEKKNYLFIIFLNNQVFLIPKLVQLQRLIFIFHANLVFHLLTAIEILKKKEANKS